MKLVLLFSFALGVYMMPLIEDLETAATTIYVQPDGSRIIVKDFIEEVIPVVTILRPPDSSEETVIYTIEPSSGEIATGPCAATASSFINACSQEKSLRKCKKQATSLYFDCLTS